MEAYSEALLAELGETHRALGKLWASPDRSIGGSICVMDFRSEALCSEPSNDVAL